MPKILVLYHYYSPDDVVSAQQFTGLCEGLTSGGFDVEVWPGNRNCHKPSLSYPTQPETVNGVLVKRVWRPAFPQHSLFGRILNAVWMQKAWAWRLFLNPGCRPDIILTGTDPLFSVGLSTFIRWIRPKTKLAHWCFDLYPEAAVADGIVGENNPLVKLLRHGLKRAYQKCDLVADLGPCMREKLEKYEIDTPTETAPSSSPSPLEGEGKHHKKTKVVTLTPWALEEPAAPMPFDIPERNALFGHSLLGLLYSGSFGRAHDFYLTLKLARLMRSSATYCYSARGSRLEALKKAVNPEDYNIRFADFAPQDKLAARLSSPDIHIVSLRPEWTGTVVPSKFFGALAIGRPVLFEGDPHSSIAKWIEDYEVGWVLRPDNLAEVAKALTQFSENEKGKTAMFKRCHKVYQENFSKTSVISRWNKELQVLLA